MRQELRLLTHSVVNFRAVNGFFPELARYDKEEAATESTETAQEPNTQLSQLDAAECLVYFLSRLGPKIDSSKTTFAHNTSDARRQSPAGLRFKSGNYFDFDSSRLADRDHDGFWEYYPPHSQVPYVYFAHRDYGALYRDTANPASGIAVAYKVQPHRWHEEDGFQIISAGVDGDFGKSKDRMYPAMTGFTAGDYDNITSFLDASFEATELQKSLRSGSGMVLAATLYVLSLGLPPGVLCIMSRFRRFSVKHFLAFFAVCGFTLGLLRWDALGFHSDVMAWRWFLDVHGATVATALCLSIVLTLLVVAIRHPASALAHAYCQAAILLVGLAFVLVLYPEWGQNRSTGTMNIEKNMGWPFRVKSAGQLGYSQPAMLGDFLFGALLVLVTRAVIRRKH